MGIGGKGPQADLYLRVGELFTCNGLMGLVRELKEALPNLSETRGFHAKLMSDFLEVSPIFARLLALEAAELVNGSGASFLGLDVVVSLEFVGEICVAIAIMKELGLFLAFRTQRIEPRVQLFNVLLKHRILRHRQLLSVGFHVGGVLGREGRVLLRGLSSDRLLQRAPHHRFS